MCPQTSRLPPGFQKILESSVTHKLGATELTPSAQEAEESPRRERKLSVWTTLDPARLSPKVSMAARPPRSPKAHVTVPGGCLKAK